MRPIRLWAAGVTIAVCLTNAGRGRTASAQDYDEEHSRVNVIDVLVLYLMNQFGPGTDEMPPPSFQGGGATANPPAPPAPPAAPDSQPPAVDPPVDLDHVTYSSTQNEDVVPIGGDSAAPQDEIMDADLRTASWFVSRSSAARLTGPSWAPARAAAGRTSPAVALPRPVAFFSGLHDGMMDMTVASAQALPDADVQRLMRSELLLVPVDRATSKRVTAALAPLVKHGSGVHVRRFTLAAYCVEAQKPQSSSATAFVIGNAAARQQFAPARTVRRVADLAATNRFLKPDSDSAAYSRFVAQYAIWTRLEHWDQARFTDEFVSRSKAVFNAQHKPWSADTEATLRALAPHRWKDVQLVTQAAERVDAKLAARGGVR